MLFRSKNKSTAEEEEPLLEPTIDPLTELPYTSKIIRILPGSVVFSVYVEMLTVSQNTNVRSKAVMSTIQDNFLTVCKSVPSRLSSGTALVLTNEA